jgi:hypothetical protein
MKANIFGSILHNNVFIGSNDNRRFRILRKQQQTQISCVSECEQTNHLLEDSVYFGIKNNQKFRVLRYQQQPKISCVSEATTTEDSFRVFRKQRHYPLFKGIGLNSLVINSLQSMRLKGLIN